MLFRSSSTPASAPLRSPAIPWVTSHRCRPCPFPPTPPTRRPRPPRPQSSRDPSARSLRIANPAGLPVRTVGLPTLKTDSQGVKITFTPPLRYSRDYKSKFLVCFRPPDDIPKQLYQNLAETGKAINLNIGPPPLCPPPAPPKK